jgi:hypothetical protein
MDYLERNKDIFDRISEQLNSAIIEDWGLMIVEYVK